MKRIRQLIRAIPFSTLVKAFREGEEAVYEVITPITAEIIMAESAYNNLYKTVYDVSNKDYGDISRLLQYCLKQNLNGKDIWEELNLALQKYPDLLSAINQVVQSNLRRAIDPEKTLMLFRILESKARMRYQEYTLKLNSIMSAFFFYVFLVPTPIVLVSSLLPQYSYVLFPFFFVSSMIMFKIFFNKIGRIRSVLLC
ncbi:MAG: hypothetical protein QW304_05930 [Thermoproteota archaeon]